MTIWVYVGKKEKYKKSEVVFLLWDQFRTSLSRARQGRWICYGQMNGGSGPQPPRSNEARLGPKRGGSK